MADFVELKLVLFDIVLKHLDPSPYFVIGQVLHLLNDRASVSHFKNNLNQQLYQYPLVSEELKAHLLNHCNRKRLKMIYRQ